MLIGVKASSEAVWLMPDDWRHSWQHAGGRLLREATDEEVAAMGPVGEPVLLELCRAVQVLPAPPMLQLIAVEEPEPVSFPPETPDPHIIARMKRRRR